MNKLVAIFNVGKVAYGPSLKLQAALANYHRQHEDTPGTLLVVEHPPVYTTGIRTKPYSIKDEEILKQTGAEFYRTNRGGLITFHGPGQLVVYPILNLKHFNLGLRNYVSNIEQTVIQICKDFNLKAETSAHTGVWIGDNKICAIGVHASRYVTTHGLALNVCTDLTWFEHIVPCGIEGKGVTSLTKELKRHVNIEEVIPVFLRNFTHVFKYPCVDISDEIYKKIENYDETLLGNKKINS
ncbi:putative lipoyltransferase 2, mitochondrial isoform X2 [Agrilus planipennis]|uniref:Octanoyl-[acyl-carrier-protein]:protein N-octanoyltransferase LIPT2, mitochondrial n=1 Tax=Agrilus planipennis TaxID=224129 RepID=A0A1W4WP61_AGRPL|nr:putative lipoyltransferase 2, mitochondrial isoform X2 [Agrilus planipennis]